MSFSTADLVYSWIDHVEHTINATVIEYVEWMTDIEPTFFLSFIRQPSESGTCFPFSPFVARKLIQNIPQGTDDMPSRLILEAGPGTGAMTKHLVKRLGPQDKLVLVEYDEIFCNTLKERFKDQINEGLVEVHHAALQDLQSWNPGNRKFDAIVSTIPLNSLPSVNVLKDIFQAFETLAKPDCHVDFGEYVGTSTLRNLVSEHGPELTAEKITFFNKHAWVPSEIEFRNIPPARVIHCMLNKQSF